MFTGVTDAEVKAILDTEISTTPFITTAHLIVMEQLYPLGRMTDARLSLIELYLSAHLACALDPRISVEKIGDSQNSYQGKTGLGLDATMYGQQVKLLDVSGVLVNSDRLKATLECV